MIKLGKTHGKFGVLTILMGIIAGIIVIGLPMWVFWNYTAIIIAKDTTLSTYQIQGNTGIVDFIVKYGEIIAVASVLLHLLIFVIAPKVFYLITTTEGVFFAYLCFRSLITNPNTSAVVPTVFFLLITVLTGIIGLRATMDVLKRKTSTKTDKPSEFGTVPNR